MGGSRGVGHSTAASEESTVIVLFWGQKASTPRLQEINDIQKQRKELVCCLLSSLKNKERM